MVIDARVASACHQKPPKVHLGSPSALSEMDFCDFSLFIGSYGPLSADAFDIRRADNDVVDAFYKFFLQSLGSWFIVCDEFTAGELGLGRGVVR